MCFITLSLWYYDHAGSFLCKKNAGRTCRVWCTRAYSCAASDIAMADIAMADPRWPKLEAALCGKLLSPTDRKVWRQAIAMLMGLKIRNGLGEKDLVAAVGTALRRCAAKKNCCEDCGVTVAGGAAIHSGGPQGGLRGPLGLPVPNNSPGPQYAQYIESRLRGT